MRGARRRFRGSVLKYVTEITEARNEADYPYFH